MTKKKLKITLIEPRGFCFGVKRALGILDEQAGEKPYVYHEIVHNKHIVDGYKAKGVTFVDNIEDIPNGATVIVSAHGVPCAFFERALDKKLNVIDATCPLVKKVHFKAHELEDAGATVIVIGKKGHAEVVGIQGQLLSQSYVVLSLDDIDTLPPMERVGCVTQTTLLVSKAHALMDALKQKYPHLILPASSTICQATTERQQAVKDAAPNQDMILVIGDVTSSNSKELVNVALANGCPAHLIESADDLKKIDLSSVERVGLTVSASAPDEILQAVLVELTK